MTMKITGITKREPVVLAGLLSAAITLAAAFGLRPNARHLAIIGAVSTLALNTVARRKVGSPNTLADLIEQLNRALGTHQPYPGPSGTAGSSGTVVVTPKPSPNVNPGTTVITPKPTPGPTPVTPPPVSPPPVSPPPVHRPPEAEVGGAVGGGIGADIGEQVGSAVGGAVGTVRSRLKKFIPFRRRK
jgi:hypothetical protein